MTALQRNFRFALLGLGLIWMVVWLLTMDPGVIVWMAFVLVVPVVLMVGNRPKLLATARKVNAPSTRTKRYVGFGLLAASAAFFLIVTVLCNRPFQPMIHDEQMHAVQLRLLSTGRLWTQSHPMADFFETFHVLMHPVYAPMHFPGTALLNVFKIWLHLPWVAIPLLLMSTGCVLTYLIVSELLGGVAGAIAAALFWSSPAVRVLSTMVISHNAFLFLAPLAVWLYLRWRKQRLVRWALALGAAVGWMAITRPVEALAFAVPIGIGVLIDAGRAGLRPAVTATLLMCLATTPFLGLQLIFDKGVTGAWLTPPYRYYNDTAYPYTSFAGPKPPGLVAPHVSNVAQQQDYYEQFMYHTALRYQRQTVRYVAQDRFSNVYSATLPSPWLIVLLPLGLVAMLRSVPLFVVGAPAVLLPVLYLLNIFYPPHYAAMAIVPMASVVLLGAKTLADTFARIAKVRVFVFAVVGMSAVLSLPPFSLMHTEEYTSDQFAAARLAREKLPGELTKPAIVLFVYRHGDDVHDEPVYNYDTVNPDDAPIIYAQSLGPRNFELMKYYQRLGQNRYVYEFVRSTRGLFYRGRVDDLAAAAPTTTAATAPTKTPATRP